MKDFDEIVPITQNGNLDSRGFAGLRLCTYDPMHHMNIYILDAHDYPVETSDVCLAPVDAIALRDALMRAYPLDEPLGFED